MDKKVLKMLNILTDEHVYSLNKLKIKLEKDEENEMGSVIRCIGIRSRI